MSEENKALARRWAEDVMNQRNLDTVGEIYASDFVGHDPAMPEDYVVLRVAENSMVCTRVLSPMPR